LVAVGGYVPPTIETVRVVNVNIGDWSVNCVSEYGNKRYFDLQVMSPYFHFMNGEGIYAMPEVGCMAWVCRPSDGEFATPFILGYQAPFDTENTSYRSGRQNLNPGDIMMRTRDENFIIMRRGGVVQIGATPTAQRIYVPIQNVIRDFCENYQLFTFGGEMTWETGRTDETTTGDAPTIFKLFAKQLANDPKHIAELSIGSHGEDDPLTMSLVVYDNGTDGRGPQVTMEIANDGTVTWSLENDWNLTVAKNILMETLEESIALTSADKFTVDAVGAIEMTSDEDWQVHAPGAKITADNIINLSSPKVRLGGVDAIHPAVKGDVLATLLSQLISIVGGLICASTGGPIGVAANGLAGSVNAIKSTTVFVK
jgi:hypothetical protein